LANPIDCLFQKFTHCSAALQGYLREVNRIYQASVQPHVWGPRAEHTVLLP
jgi:hypothetical protein